MNNTSLIKHTVNSWNKALLKVNYKLMSYKLIKFDILFQLYSNFDGKYTCNSKQFCRSLSNLIAESKEYHKECIRDKELVQKEYFIFYFYHLRLSVLTL